MGNVMMEASQINYRGGAEKMSVEQALKETSGEAAAIAALQATKANQATIAPVFDATASYTVGDLVYYENAIYRCTTDHTGAWAAADFAATSVETEILRAAAVKADESGIAPAFDATATYEAGDLVYYNGTIYRCTNDHTGDWDATDFSATTIAGELNGLNSNITNGVVDTTSVQDVRFVKVGRMVTMISEVWHQGFTVPTSFRPWATAHLAVRVSTGGGTGATIGYIRVGTDGALTIPDFTDFVGTVSWVTA